MQCVVSRANYDVHICVDPMTHSNMVFGVIYSNFYCVMNFDLFVEVAIL